MQPAGSVRSRRGGCAVLLTLIREGIGAGHGGCSTSSSCGFSSGGLGNDQAKKPTINNIFVRLNGSIFLFPGPGCPSR